MKKNITMRMLTLLMAASLIQTRLCAEQRTEPCLTACSGSESCLQTPTLTPEAQAEVEQILQETVDRAVREALQIQEEALREQSEAQMTAISKSRSFWLKAALVEAALLGVGTYLALRTR